MLLAASHRVAALAFAATALSFSGRNAAGGSPPPVADSPADSAAIHEAATVPGRPSASQHPAELPSLPVPAQPPQSAEAESGEMGEGAVRRPAVPTVKDELLGVLPADSTSAGPREDVARLELARHQRSEGQAAEAARTLAELLKGDASVDIQRSALLELGRIAQDLDLQGRAQQIYAQFVTRYPRDPAIVEVLLRQGVLYRKMGATQLAISKFYSVMTTALRLRLDQFEQFQRLVLQSQIEIADTHYLDGRWADAAEFLSRLLKLDSNYLNRGLVQFKLIRALAMQEDVERTASEAESFLKDHAEAAQVPEVRFLLAKAYKHQGRTQDALEQVLQLLQSQRASASVNPDSWAYWQKRAGNEIGNELYREGDYVGTLQIYQRLAELDSSLDWQLPVWYQMGLVYERLSQPAKATELYEKVMARAGELGGEKATPTLKLVADMASWRRDNITWLQKAIATAAILRPLDPSSLTATDHERAAGNP